MMKCDVCARREARAVIAMVVNGKQTTRRVCGKCIARLQRGDAYAAQMALLSTMENTGQHQVCPSCGRTAADLIRSGHVGCAACYRALDETLSVLMSRLNGAPPAEENAPREQPGSFSNGKTARIAALRDEMFAAVNAEEYERAAQLRDEIRLLEQERGEETE